jgi:hypothetical protein
MRVLIAAAAALTLGATPALAAPAAKAQVGAANPASSLSVAAPARAGAKAKGRSNLAGASIVPILIGAGIIAGGAYLIIDNENDDDDSDSN